ncbi:Tfp pilus assembly protein FimT/FimU [Acinetobacter sp. MB5]|uniref:pilus assembly FimT family protein n=1 Tax=Acinetobacter sp. MB5 TaxID=2069438 RepID=UPI000DD0A9D0|nr:prepilin-type N-terminal cleavage/methylation domain-containing protein [Acinetobacter sp. MB5]
MVERDQRGATLIELLVVLIIAAIIVGAITPIGRSWVATAHVSKAQSVLTQAFNKAKTEALKNPNKVLTDATNPTVATITVNNTAKTITVSDSSSTTIWSDSFDSDVTITLATACSSKILLNNTVQFLNSSTPTTVDNTCSSYTIAASTAQTVTGVLR